MVPQERNYGVEDMDHDISSEQNASKTFHFSSRTTQSPLIDDVFNLWFFRC